MPKQSTLPIKSQLKRGPVPTKHHNESEMRVLSILNYFTHHEGYIPEARIAHFAGENPKTIKNILSLLKRKRLIIDNGKGVYISSQGVKLIHSKNIFDVSKLPLEELQKLRKTVDNLIKAGINVPVEARKKIDRKILERKK